jgi:hypothetical protein
MAEVSILARPRGRALPVNTSAPPLGHWFSVMGTFLPFEIITYAM